MLSATGCEAVGADAQPATPRARRETVDREINVFMDSTFENDELVMNSGISTYENADRWSGSCGSSIHPRSTQCNLGANPPSANGLFNWRKTAPRDDISVFAEDICPPLDQDGLPKTSRRAVCGMAHAERGEQRTGSQPSPPYGYSIAAWPRTNAVTRSAGEQTAYARAFAPAAWALARAMTAVGRKLARRK
jgi:hypothetical protein